MKTTIDRAGRLVIPRGLRAQVGLLEGGEVSVEVRGAAILIEPVPGPDLQVDDGFLVVAPSGQAIDDDAVRELRLADQR
jgi:AbrB family looped-hinge helix DNA binding protein